jgi:hypothetical protein
MSELSNEKIITTTELRVHKNLQVPRKETIGQNEVAVNNAGAILVKNAAGVTQTIGATVVPPTPGLAAVAAADASAIGRSISVTGTVTATGVTAPTVGASTSLLTPLITSTANLTITPATGKIIIGGDSMLTGSAPSVPITVTAVSGNTTATLGSPSTAMAGFFNLDTSAAVAAGQVTIVVPCNALFNDPNITFQVKTAGAYQANMSVVQVGAVSVAGSAITFNAVFSTAAAVPSGAGIKVYWFIVGRA